MPKIVFLPHDELCPEGAVVEAASGDTILDVALREGINIRMRLLQCDGEFKAIDPLQAHGHAPN